MRREVGETVSVFYNTTDPGQIVILNIPGGGIAGIAGTLRTAGIVCLDRRRACCSSPESSACSPAGNRQR